MEFFCNQCGSQSTIATTVHSCIDMMAKNHFESLCNCLDMVKMQYLYKEPSRPRRQGYQLLIRCIVVAVFGCNMIVTCSLLVYENLSLYAGLMELCYCESIFSVCTYCYRTYLISSVGWIVGTALFYLVKPELMKHSWMVQQPRTFCRLPLLPRLLDGRPTGWSIRQQAVFPLEQLSCWMVAWHGTDALSFPILGWTSQLLQ